MRKFQMRQLAEAEAFAAGGGQALHLHNVIVDRSKAPSCFVRAVDRGEDIAHLFDQDHERLVATAKKLGVRVIQIEYMGQPRQHIDLCGGPLKKALALCEE